MLVVELSTCWKKWLSDPGRATKARQVLSAAALTYVAAAAMAASQLMRLLFLRGPVMIANHSQESVNTPGWMCLGFFQEGIRWPRSAK